MEQRVTKVHRVQQVLTERMVMMVLKALRVPQEAMELMVMMVLKDLKALTV